MKPHKGHTLDFKIIEGVELTIERYGKTGEVNRVFIGEVQVNDFLDHVQSSSDIFAELEPIREVDSDGIYERSAGK